MDDPLYQPISALPRTASRTIAIFKKLDIEIFADLLAYFPSRHEDYSSLCSIGSLQSLSPPEGKFTVSGTVVSFGNNYTARRFTLQKLRLADDSGQIEAVWFNQPYLRQIMVPGTRIALSGTLKVFRNQTSIQPEEYEILLDESTVKIHTGRLAPVYPQTRGLSTKTIREKIYYLLATYSEQIREILPELTIREFALITESAAYEQIHFPETKDDFEAARGRLSFDELFIIQLSSALIKQQWQKEVVGHAFRVEPYQSELKILETSLPFKLTSAQQKCIEAILADLSRQQPMNRLLQGDVGSGKTVVAAFGAYLAHLNGFKTLMMAPTEILAAQHYASLQAVFSGLKKPVVKIELVTSSHKPSKQALDDAAIVIGTHALVSGKAVFTNVGLVVVDEQQKFGVVQRAKLKKQGINPHLLSMTATPIPRTVALTLFGELEMSVIDEMPWGRLKVKTHLVPPPKRDDAYSWIAQQVKESKAQVFIVCPLIDESVAETMQNVKAANVEYEKLSKEIFPKLRVGLLHGRMKSKEKEAVIHAFATAKLDILVSTPVVEVGIDIPQATIMVVEAAERFGLAQLHQLRGRVGRADKQSYCLLFTEKSNPPVLQRLQFFSTVHDGFELAQYDLENRGSGNIYGTQQHGLAGLAIADLSDRKLIEQTQKAVKSFIKKNYLLRDYPELEKRVTQYRTRLIARD